MSPQEKESAQLKVRLLQLTARIITLETQIAHHRFSNEEQRVAFYDEIRKQADQNCCSLLEGEANSNPLAAETLKELRQKLARSD